MGYKSNLYGLEINMPLCSFYSLLFGYVLHQYASESKELSDDVCRKSGVKLICNVIQRDIPDGVKSVHLENIIVPGRILKNGTFSSHNWGKIEDLKISTERRWVENHDTVETFASFCFDGLKSLKTLHISISSSIQFQSHTLRGLPNLKLLDLSGCRRFYINNLITALNDTEAVPNLRSIYISHMNSFRSENRLTDDFFKLISKKEIKELDISSMQLLFINITSFEENCGTLELLNISKLRLSDYARDNVARYCPNLKYIDASYMTLPSTAFPDQGPVTKVFSNRSLLFDFNWTPLRLLSNIEHIDLSGIEPKQTRILLENVSVHIFGINRFSLRTLVLKDNNLERLDLKVSSRKAKLESIDLSNCNIRYLHPGLLSSFKLLTKIDVSYNHLNEMMEEDVGMFRSLFHNLTLLKYVNLAGNHLTHLPLDIFEYNSEIEIIDISNNLLTQVTFDVKRLEKLKMIKLAGNLIKILNDASIAGLNNFLHKSDGTNSSTMDRLLILTGNPISCSTCDSLSSLKWLVHSESMIRHFSTLECSDEHTDKVGIDPTVIDNVQKICNRSKVITLSCVAVASTIAIVITLALVILYRRRRRRIQLEMEDRVALIRQGADSHQFVVFLSYCSKDDDFVYKYVYDPLNKHLKNMIGENRDLVCEGDRDFQLGQPIHDQISLLLKKSSVVVVLLTDNYSLSIHCRNEFDQAFMLEKPIVLMVKDHVDTALMTPLLRDLYEKKTRILWLWENGQYVLKTSWENLSISIVELVDRT